METFKYYKRGAGELDTSNFPTLAEQEAIEIDRLDEKTFMSLLALNEYMAEIFIDDPRPHLVVTVNTYVAHLRGDKDVFPTASLYSFLHMMKINCVQIQHESTEEITSSHIDEPHILSFLPTISMDDVVTFVGADSSVPKFFNSADFNAHKVREDGKVTSMSFPAHHIDQDGCVVIVDDLLGGGATVQMLVDIIREDFTGDIHLWVQYNEGFHTEEFLSQFASYYIGQEV